MLALAFLVAIGVLLIELKLADPPTVAISEPLYVPNPLIVIPLSVPKLVIFGCAAVNTAPLNPELAVTPAALTVVALTVVAETLPVNVPLNAPVNVVAATVPAVTVVPVIAAAVIPADPSRCTKVLAVAAVDWLLRPQVGLAVVLKLIPARILANPVNELLNVSFENMA